MINSNRTAPEVIESKDYLFDSFENGKVLHNKKKNHLPAMGWNSWNAFGSGNNEELTRAQAAKIIELGLDKLGYKYLVLDDGCYLNERVDGKLTNNPEKFPSGFRALADHLHGMGLKFGMYNDIGTNLCAGAAVGTCGHESEDAKSYIDWGVDFLKVDNCYYLWDNATFSDATNAKYVYAPAIASVTLTCGNYKESFTAGRTISVTGEGVKTETIGDKLYFTNIGTFDGTGPFHTPCFAQSGELSFTVNSLSDSVYTLELDCICGEEPEKGSWLQIAVANKQGISYVFDNIWDGTPVNLSLIKGENNIRLMNHRRQENTLIAYAKLLEGLNEADPDHDIIYSMCEWGKTQPQNWAKKVGDSWRILNDISFAVGSDGNPGHCDWESDYTTSITAQYNKAVIMDEFAGLDKGWNDPDMMVIGMDHLDLTQYRTHMTMWCMMNSPLMLGLDLRRVQKGDDIYKIIANEELIKLNQDPLGVQAKRVYSTLLAEGSDKEYITNNNRVDILAKPLTDGVAISFINLSKSDKKEGYAVTKSRILNCIGSKLPAKVLDAFINASTFSVTDLWTGEENLIESEVFSVSSLAACDNVTIKITAR